MSISTAASRLGARRTLAVPVVLALLVWAGPVAAQILGSGDTSLAPAVRFLGWNSGGQTAELIDASRVALLRRRVSLAFEAIRLDSALARIARTGGLRFAYSGAEVPVANRVSLNAEDMTLAAVLTDVLIDAGVDVVVAAPDQLILRRRWAGERTARGDTLQLVALLSGFVTDSASGAPVAAAEILIDSLRLRTLTNVAGYYKLAVPAGVLRVSVRRIGYQPARREVTMTDSTAVLLNIPMVAAPTKLQDMVTTATGPQRRYELGNAVTIINADSIVATQPVHSVAELLETRVPGLTATHTSGAPGDPTRLRLRGLNSITRSNDPIVIVDGVRIYAEQSDPLRGANMAVVNSYDRRPITGRPDVGESLTERVAIRSPLEQIDPNSIATVELFKGPSAATLYGADAANGVIVITTKKGRPGNTQWNYGMDFGATYLPGKYPMAYARWGRDQTTGALSRCPLTAYGCTVDSLVRYQLLNDPKFSPLGTGHRAGITGGVSGGTQRVTYAVNGSYSNESGLLKLPDFEVQRYEGILGRSMPGWMKHPEGLSDWSGTGHLSVQLSTTTDFSFTSSVDHSTQRRSTLDQQLSGLMTLYYDPGLGIFYPGSGISGDGRVSNPPSTQPTEVDLFRVRTSTTATAFTEAATLAWRPLRWLATNAQVGLNAVNREDLSSQGALTDSLTPIYGQNFLAADPSPFYNQATGNSVVTTTNVGAVAILPLPRGLTLRTAVGGGYTRTKTKDLIAAGIELLPNATGLDGARKIIVTPQHSEVTTFGWYIEPSLSTQRFTVSTGFRVDGGDTYGSRNSLAGFPKISASYVISEEPFFPFKRQFNTLRLRAAYGQAGVQPGPSDRLRLFQAIPGWFDSTFVTQSDLSGLGNSNLKPERSTEFEGGVDADIWDNRISLELTGYVKTRLDALVPMPLPPSVNGGGTLLVNIGKVRNSGVEASASTNLFRGSAVSLSTQFHVSWNRNRVLSTGAVGSIDGPDGTRIVKGYPLFGYWAKPIVHYDDVNGDGILTTSEVQVGSKPVFIGAPEPNYEAALYTNFSFVRGLVTVSAGFQYTDGQLQINRSLESYPFTIRGANDPTAPLSEQAAVVASQSYPNATNYGLAQVVSTVRFNSLAIAFNAPPRIAGLFGTRSASLTIQGTNLGLHSNYRGKDPAVNAYASGNIIADTGQLPLPRTWAVGLRFGL